MLGLEDILDLRAYERVREEFRRKVIAKKRLRRVALGPIMTAVFECEETVKFQVQEMARVEKIISDEGIRGELDAYNCLLPSENELSATLFIELTEEADLRHWLSRLTGIERSVSILLGPKDAASVVRAFPEAGHASTLTRDAVTPAVHYLRFRFRDSQVAELAEGPASLVVEHPAYQAHSELSEATRAELVADLAGEVRA